eukprot:TRINITY_DN46604_c0_g1_i1.p2 TRINITY_DN46604_c0_g1~~TRINITY_DN46604_c0_g1_i1.p2  ORF type:complete len:153 (+),score=21.53 TRINITY_DN46604_c0_g1_i1:336-794(+)
MASAATETVGPGSYSPWTAGSNSPRTGGLANKERPRSGAGFNASSPRFPGSATATPGPGEYRRQLATQLTASKTVGFGAGSPRFKSSTTDTPSPASYHQAPKRAGPVREKRPTPRFSTAANDHPGPGSYSSGLKSDFDYVPRKTNWQPRQPK